MTSLLALAAWCCWCIGMGYLALGLIQAFEGFEE